MKEIITMILTGSIACMFAVAPAFAADNDLGIQQREDRVAAKNGGNLTEKGKTKLTRQQNKASKNIYKKKHNARTANVGK